MSSKEKLLKRFCTLPANFTFDELVRVFRILGYELDNKGTTSGSRGVFIKGDACYRTHRPHPGNIVKRAAVIDAYNYLSKRELSLWNL